jgi:hypothetical protein
VDVPTIDHDTMSVARAINANRSKGKFFEAYRNPFGHKSYPGSNKRNIGFPGAKTNHLLNECAFPNAHKQRQKREINRQLNQRIDPGLCLMLNRIAPPTILRPLARQIF